MPETAREEAGRATASSLLDEPPEVNAIYATVNAFAVDVVPALTDGGLRVPADVMVTTRYDGLRARTCTPALTAIDLHLDQCRRTPAYQSQAGDHSAGDHQPEARPSRSPFGDALTR
ncbi:substrate-binding domain-containing protein [Saccharopolyspora spinosa]|uniref:substrate-binding domain-containing protein n=1 Tax=Saccharopolyspora spinosa TaxID=60894 RepID=UPI0037484747